MWSLAWPWMFLASPLPLLARAILSPVTETQEAGLKVPSFEGFAVLTNRARSEQLMNWRVWI
ncbi:MAG: BatB protein, partial [Gammaproteobacteria bacterium]